MIYEKRGQADSIVIVDLYKDLSDKELVCAIINACKQEPKFAVEYGKSDLNAIKDKKEFIDKWLCVLE